MKTQSQIATSSPNERPKWDKRIHEALDKVAVAASAVIGVIGSAVVAIAALFGKQVPVAESASLFGICMLLWRTVARVQTVDGKVSVIEALNESLATQKRIHEERVKMLQKLLPLASARNHEAARTNASSADTFMAQLVLQSSTFPERSQPFVDPLFWDEWGKCIIERLKQIDFELEASIDDKGPPLQRYQEKRELLCRLNEATTDLSLWIDKDWKYKLIRILIARMHFLAAMDGDTDPYLYRAVAVEEDIDNIYDDDQDARELLLEVDPSLTRFCRIFFIPKRSKMINFLSDYGQPLIKQITAGAALKYCEREPNLPGLRPIEEIGIYSRMAFGNYTKDGTKANTICFQSDEVRVRRETYKGWWDRSETIRTEGGRLFLSDEVVYEDPRKMMSENYA